MRHEGGEIGRKARTVDFDKAEREMNSGSGGGGGWKFTRVPNLQRVIRVAANSTGG
jgi:hypothetical protein